MKNIAVLRIIVGLWFGILGYLLIPFLMYSFHSTSWQFISSIAISFFAFCIGFFYGHKTFFHPADYLNGFITKFPAAVWGGAVGLILAFITLSPFSSSSQITTMVVFTLFTLVFMLLGMLYGYRLLLLPQIPYIKPFPTIKERIISMLWFGVVACPIQAFFIHGLRNPNSIFVIAFVAYLGFAYGYRILLLPTSLKGAIKAVMLGFIGSSSIVLIMMLLVFLPLFSPSHQNMGQSPIIMPIIDNTLSAVIWMEVIFLVASLFACVATMLATLILYILAIVSRL